MVLHEVQAPPSVSRRSLLRAVALGLSVVGGGCAPLFLPGGTPVPTPRPTATPTFIPAKQFTPWGWPLPYEPISAGSVDWLQEHSWWPLGIAYRPLFSGSNAVAAMMIAYQLANRRGLDATFAPVFSATLLEQTFVAGRVQVASADGTIVALMLQHDVPVTSVAIQVPNLKVGTVVPASSPLRRFADLRGTGATIGVEFDSLAVAYLVAAAAVNGLTVNQDFFLLGIETAIQANLPRTASAFAPWDPVLSHIVDEQQIGRVIDNVFPYHFSNTHLIVRQELVENVPDVVQALVDAYQEAILLVRYQPRQAVELLQREPRLREYSSGLLTEQTIAYNNLYKPTFAYPFQDFWATEASSISSLLALNGQQPRPIDLDTWRSVISPRFMQFTYARLGWRVPDRPPWIPPGWSGTIGKPPYPEYLTIDSLTRPQPWPEPSDLVRPWQFAGTTYYP